jgi:hypothetical protein
MNVSNNPNIDAHLMLKLIDDTEKQGQLTTELKFLRISTLAKTRKFAELQQ